MISRVGRRLRDGIVTLALTLAACGSNTSQQSSKPKFNGILPATSCPPGSMARVGQAGCAAVGTTTCSDGFRRAASGWGCEAVLPGAACSGATRAALGSTACIDIDDCNAPFPPPAALEVVSDTSSLQSALAQAPAGALIALDSGNYGAVTIPEDVTLVGRCARKVVFHGPGARGIYVVGNIKLGLSSLTVEGFTAGVVAAYGPAVSLSQVVLRGNTIGLLVGEASADIRRSVLVGAQVDTPSNDQQSEGIVAISGAHVTASDIEIRDDRSALEVYDKSTTLDLARSVISYVGPVNSAILVSAYTGAKVDIDQSSLRTRDASLIIVGRELPISYPKPPPPASVDVKGSELRQTGANDHRGLVIVTDSASVTFHETTLHHQSLMAIMVGNSASVTLDNSTITSEPVWDMYRSALFVTNAGTARLDGVAVIDAYQNALLVGHSGSSLVLQRSLVLGTEFRGPGPDAKLGGAALAIGVGDGADLQMDQSTIAQTAQFSLFADGSSHLSITGSLIDKTATSQGVASGDGIVLTDKAELSMSDSMVRSSTGNAVVVDNAIAKLQSTGFVENGAVLQLDGSTLSRTATDPITPGTVLFLDNKLFENEAFIRRGPISLPSVTIP